GTNPLLTNSDARRTCEALMRLDLLTVSETFMTPMAALADIVLPAATTFEFDDIGYYGLSHGWIASRPKIIEPPAECWPDIKILNELAKALGHGAHFWEDSRQALEEVLAPAGITFEQFKKQGRLKGKKIYLKYEEEGFRTPSKKIEFYADRLKAWGFDPLPGLIPIPEPSLEYPLIATSRKNSHFFNSAGRQISRLRKKHPLPTVEVHPQTARILGLKEGEWVRIKTAVGSIEQVIKHSEDIDPRVVFVDYGWWFPEKEKDFFDWGRSNLNILTSAEPFNPVLGTPNLRGFPCRLEKIAES
ncbi:MAG TPA: molybdopterin dinucleotide binding domain-containing protein, partial [Thermodesulfobacteriota bacterium]|nr:molybdopterin dinucleotide binding domain-containing protein [Thermodesulfobacteriota bacterium]